MKTKTYYEQLFANYPDIVTLEEFCEMLGGTQALLAGFSVSSYDLLDVTPRSHQAEWEKRN